MMQREHVQVAAQHALAILRWAPSTTPIDNDRLRDAFETIYRDSDPIGQRSLRYGSYEAWKSITFDGVQLAYAHFFGKDADSFAIKKFLMEAGDNEDWGILVFENSKFF